MADRSGVPVEANTRCPQRADGLRLRLRTVQLDPLRFLVEDQIDGAEVDRPGQSPVLRCDQGRGQDLDVRGVQRNCQAGEFRTMLVELSALASPNQPTRRHVRGGSATRPRSAGPGKANEPDLGGLEPELLDLARRALAEQAADRPTAGELLSASQGTPASAGTSAGPNAVASTSGAVTRSPTPSAKVATAAGPLASSTTPQPPSGRKDPFEPAADSSKPRRGLNVTARTTGTCQSSNVSVRTDAHRCFLDTEIGGGNILDPCFEAPMGSEMLLCQESPWANRAVQVTMTNTPDTGSGDADPMSGDPLFLLTVDGRRCGFMGGGTYVLANLRANYSCCEGGGTAFGSPDRSTTAWTIKFQTARGSDLTDLAIGQALGE
jgi:hypothetical protein